MFSSERSYDKMGFLFTGRHGTKWYRNASELDRVYISYFTFITELYARGVYRWVAAEPGQTFPRVTPHATYLGQVNIYSGWARENKLSPVLITSPITITPSLVYWRVVKSTSYMAKVVGNCTGNDLRASDDSGKMIFN